ncbi:Cell wall integrity and stress response component 4 like [Actinidia chinensis var. chinensis]|uniref:Cell wall integrity and stress response component 4 like n=1 Tax=Actinidia chinensis var. chinensis TaxID=1590841 RepID=A0A2R6PQP2_ACTCC|nr:Cell wall integrity and stress response component 4 like [Actinidia chinensis var. chinensis]
MEEQQDPPPTTSNSLLILRLMSKRRTWVFLFVLVYTLLLSSSWNILKSILSWYESNSSSATPSSSSSGWPALYASVALGVVFGLISMAAALSVAVPATVVTWITVLVLLAFCGKPRRALVVEGKKLTAEICWLVGKILIKEGNVVAAVCAIVGYFMLVRRSREEVGPP